MFVRMSLLHSIIGTSC